MGTLKLTELQHLYLQEIFNLFHVQGAWPTFRSIERELNKQYPEMDIDVESVAASLPEGLSNVVTWNDPKAEAILTVPAVYLCKNSTSDLADFVWAIRLCIETFVTSQEESPSFSSDGLRNELSMPELSLRKVGLLIQNEPGIYRSFGWNEDTGSWRLEIARDIRRFRGVETIEQYLEKRIKPGKAASNISPQPTASSPSEVGQSSTMVAAEELGIHPEIRSKCWNLYLSGNYDNAILNATKALEVAVRAKAHLPDDSVGAPLMAEAFKPDKPLLRYSKTRAEQEGLMSLLRGIIQVFKNPQSHRFVGVQNKADCLGLLLVCSSLLYIIENSEYTGTP